jgi:hypothetical protein
VAQATPKVAIGGSPRLIGVSCASILGMADQTFSLSDVMAATDRRLDAGLTAAARVTRWTPT